MSSELVERVKFLRDAGNHFENLDTHGEDMAFWANVYNAKNCREAADLIERQAGLLETALLYLTYPAHLRRCEV